MSIKKIKKELGFFAKMMIKLFGHKAIDYGVDNTAVKWVAETPMKTDDHLVEKFVRPTLHELFDLAMNKFEGISIKDYFKKLWNDGIAKINSVESLDAMISDLEAHKQYLLKNK